MQELERLNQRLALKEEESLLATKFYQHQNLEMRKGPISRITLEMGLNERELALLVQGAHLALDIQEMIRDRVKTQIRRIYDEEG